MMHKYCCGNPEDGVNDKLCTYGRSIYSLKNGPIVYSSHSTQFWKWNDPEICCVNRNSGIIPV